MSALNLEGSAYTEAKIYLAISLFGLLFIFGYNALSAIMRGLGDNKTPLIFVGVAGALNIILDLVFVAGLHLGAGGAAAATIIAQAVSAVTSIIYAYKKIPYFRLTKTELAPHRKIIFMSVKLGIPIALQNSLIAVSCIVLQSVVNRFGPLVMASFTITGRTEQIVQQGFSSLHDRRR